MTDLEIYPDVWDGAIAFLTQKVANTFREGSQASRRERDRHSGPGR